jgi:hypothetical protein
LRFVAIRTSVRSEEVILKGTLENGLYLLESKPRERESDSSNKAQLLNLEVVSDWHSRLGHLSSQTVGRLIRGGRTRCPTLANERNTEDICPSCAKGKMTANLLKEE